MVTNKNKTQWRSRVAKFELGRKGGDLWRNGFRMTQSATIYKRTCLRWTNGVKKVKWAKNSMKHLKRPTSVISHQFPVELVQNVPKLWKQIIVICTALAFALSSLLSFPCFYSGCYQLLGAPLAGSSQPAKSDCQTNYRCKFKCFTQRSNSFSWYWWTGDVEIAMHKGRLGKREYHHLHQPHHYQHYHHHKHHFIISFWSR